MLQVDAIFDGINWWYFSKVSKQVFLKIFLPACKDLYLNAQIKIGLYENNFYKHSPEMYKDNFRQNLE